MKLTKILTLLLIATLLSSCNKTEELYFRHNLFGNYKYTGKTNFNLTTKLKYEKGAAQILVESDKSKLEFRTILANANLNSTKNEAVFSGITHDIKYNLLENGIRELIIIKSRSETNQFTSYLKLENLTHKQESGTIKFYDQNNNYKFELDKPYAYDAAGSRTDGVEYKIHENKDQPGSFELTKIVNPDWLFSNQRVYPITIDPTIITIQASKVPTMSENFYHDNIKIADTTPIVKFGADDDQNDALVYEIQWHTDSDFVGASSAVSDANAGFANETTPADTSPFNSGETVTYTFQSALTNNTTYFYRLRAKDPGGENTFSSWSSTRSISINTSTVDSTWFQTEDDQFTTNFKTSSVTVNASTNDAEASDTSSNTRYYKPITITNGGVSTLTNHDVLVSFDTATLISGGKMASDCSDFRVASDNDGQTTLNFWIEQGCNSTATQIWVEVPSLPSGDTTIYFIYDYVTGITDSQIAWSGNFIVANNNSCLPGWNRDTTLDNTFLRGNSSYGGTGGSTAHSHTYGGYTGYDGGVGASSLVASYSRGAHNHAYSGTAVSATNNSIPSYINFVFCTQSSPLDMFAQQYFGFYQSTPTGWTALSGQDDRYPRGASSYGSTGGSTTHTHTYSHNTGQGGNYTTNTASSGAGGADPTSGHTHSISGTTGSGTTIPPYKSLYFATPNATESALPVSVILAVDTAPPLGWNRYDSLDSKLLRIGTGGSSATGFPTHTHTESGTVGAYSGANTYTGGTDRDITGNHNSHNYSFTTGVPNSTLPPYKDHLFYQKGDDGVTVSVGTEVLLTSFIRSSAIVADYLGNTDGKWDTLSFTDDETNGDLKYQIYYNNNGTPTIVSNSDLAGNSTGFDTSPVDISTINSITYPTIYVVANFNYSGGSAKLQDWTVTINSAPEAPTLDSPTNTQTGRALTPELKLTTTDTNSDNLKYIIELCSDSGMSLNCQTFDQTSSQTGWSGQNADSSTTFTSGTQATYTIQTALSQATTYYWRARAIDPSGSNLYSPYSSTYSFTTGSSPNTPTLDAPTNGATNQSLTPALKTTTTDPDSDNIKYRIYLCTESTMEGCQIFSQVSSQTGWSGQNADGSTTYTSGTQGTYTLQSPLLGGKTYYWKSQAIDPSNSNSWGATQVSPYSFTTAASPNIPEECTLETANNSSSITLSWLDKSSNEDGFNIERNAGGGGFTSLTDPSSNTTSYQDTTVSTGTSYSYRVRSYRTVSSVTAYSEWCTTSTLNIPAPGSNSTKIDGGLNLDGINID